MWLFFNSCKFFIWRECEKILILTPVLEKEMIRQGGNILSINVILGSKGSEPMTIACASSTNHTTTSAYFRHKIQDINIS